MTARTFTFTVTSSLPSWVPAANVATTLTMANGKLTNTFASVIPVYSTAFYSKKIVTDDSGGGVNPHYGQWGATVFEGGGHATTNANHIIQLELGTSACTFRCLLPGSSPYGTTAGAAYANDTTSDSSWYSNAWAEYADGKVASRHSYGSFVVQGPADGGAANGTLWRVQEGSLGQSGWGQNGTGSVGFIPHKVAIASVGSAVSYARAGTLGGWTGGTAVPTWDAYAKTQNRIYSHYRGSTQVRWFDINSGTYSTGTGTAAPGDYDVTGGNPQGCLMLEVPDRDLLLWCDVKNGALRIYYLNVAAGNTNPSWTGPVTISPSVTLPVKWCSGGWCSDNSRLIVGSPSQTSGVYEITIPANLSSTWASEWVPFASGTVPFPLAGTYKQWAYNPKAKSFVFYPLGYDSGGDVVYVYRPRNT